MDARFKSDQNEVFLHRENTNFVTRVKLGVEPAFGHIALVKYGKIYYLLFQNQKGILGLEIMPDNTYGEEFLIEKKRDGMFLMLINSIEDFTSESDSKTIPSILIQENTGDTKLVQLTVAKRKRFAQKSTGLTFTFPNFEPEKCWFVRTQSNCLLVGSSNQSSLFCIRPKGSLTDTLDQTCSHVEIECNKVLCCEYSWRLSSLVILISTDTDIMLFGLDVDSPEKLLLPVVYHTWEISLITLQKSPSFHKPNLTFQKITETDEIVLSSATYCLILSLEPEKTIIFQQLDELPFAHSIFDVTRSISTIHASVHSIQDFTKLEKIEITNQNKMSINIENMIAILDEVDNEKTNIMSKQAKENDFFKILTILSSAIDQDEKLQRNCEQKLWTDNELISLNIFQDDFDNELFTWTLKLVTSGSLMGVTLPISYYRLKFRLPDKKMDRIQTKKNSKFLVEKRFKLSWVQICFEYGFGDSISIPVQYRII